MNSHKHDKAPEIYLCDFDNCDFECENKDDIKSHKTEHMAGAISHKIPNNADPNSSYAEKAKLGEKNTQSQNMNPWIGPFKNGKPTKNYSNNKHYAYNHRYNNYENTPAASHYHRSLSNYQIKSKQTAIKGSNSSSPLAVAPRPHWAKIFATGFPTNTNLYNIKNDLEYNIEHFYGKKFDVKLDELETRYNTYKSFKISCFCSESEIFMDSKIWPENILVKWFKERRIPRDGPNQRSYY